MADPTTRPRIRQSGLQSIAFVENPGLQWDRGLLSRTGTSDFGTSETIGQGRVLGAGRCPASSGAAVSGLLGRESEMQEWRIRVQVRKLWDVGGNARMSIFNAHLSLFYDKGISACLMPKVGDCNARVSIFSASLSKRWVRDHLVFSNARSGYSNAQSSISYSPSIGTWRYCYGLLIKFCALRLVKHCKVLLQEKQEDLCIRVLQTLQRMMPSEETHDRLVSAGWLWGCWSGPVS